MQDKEFLKTVELMREAQIAFNRQMSNKTFNTLIRLEGKVDAQIKLRTLNNYHHPDPRTNKFYELVHILRQAQRAYNRSRDIYTQNIARELEDRIDAIILRETKEQDTSTTQLLLDF